jgi:hypothetical protein
LDHGRTARIHRINNNGQKAATPGTTIKRNPNGACSAPDPADEFLA